MHQGKRALEIRIAQVGIIGAKLVGEEHAFVDQRAAGDRHWVIVRGAPFVLAVQCTGDGLAQDVEPAFEFILRRDFRIAADEDLFVHRLGRLHGLAERRIVSRYVPPAEHLHAVARGKGCIGVHDLLAPGVVARQEQCTDGVVAGGRQLDAEFGCLLGNELVRYLDQNAGAVAGARIGADRAAMLEIDQDCQRVFDDPVRFASLDVGNKSDPAGIFFQRRIK